MSKYSEAFERFFNTYPAGAYPAGTWHRSPQPEGKTEWQAQREAAEDCGEFWGPMLVAALNSCEAAAIEQADKAEKEFVDTHLAEFDELFVALALEKEREVIAAAPAGKGPDVAYKYDHFLTRAPEFKNNEAKKARAANLAKFYQRPEFSRIKDNVAKMVNYYAKLAIYEQLKAVPGHPEKPTLPRLKKAA